MTKWASGIAFGLATLLVAGAVYADPPPIDAVQAPRGDDRVEAPRGQDEVQAPRGQDDVQAPRGQDDVQAPRSQEVQAPRG